MRIAVVGCGVMGAATAWALTARGHEVIVFERFEVGHKRGSSHGGSRIIASRIGQRLADLVEF